MLTPPQVRSAWNDLKDLNQNLGAFSNDLADRVERDFNLAADSIRAAAQHAPWLPEAIRPPPPPPRSACCAAAPSLGYLGRLQCWVNRNRALTAALLAFVGTGTFLVWRRRRLLRQRRRARRAPNGAKTELVVLAGSPFVPLTRSLALDLERRGFLVHIPVGSPEEEAAVLEYRGSDIRPLNFDVTSVRDARSTPCFQALADTTQAESTAAMLAKLHTLLTNPRRHGTRQLHLASLVLLDDPRAHATGAIAALPAAAWADALNVHVLHPIALAHAFLPLLASSAQNPPPLPPATGDERTAAPPFPPTTLVLCTSGIAPAVHPPRHAPEALVGAALTSFLATLRAEAPAALRITHLRLGALPSASLLSRAAPSAALARRAPAASDASASPSDASPARGASTGRASRTPAKRDRQQQAELRRLHEGVFDAVVGRSAGTAFAGRGARAYALVGAWAPRGLVRWMLGAGAGEGGLGAAPMGAPAADARDAEERSSESGGDRGGSDRGGSVEWEKVEGHADGA